MVAKDSRPSHVRGLTLLGMLTLSGVCFYGAYDAITTGATKAPGRNNTHYVTRASNPQEFRTLVKFDLAGGVLFTVIGIGGFLFSGRK
jgi:hypothetical protein